MNTEIRKHPSVTEWDKWRSSQEGAECATPAASLQRQYLENRLWLAFMAGWKACAENKKA
jgi:hypothetical protein